MSSLFELVSRSSYAASYRRTIGVRRAAPVCSPCEVKGPWLPSRSVFRQLHLPSPPLASPRPPSLFLRLLGFLASIHNAHSHPSPPGSNDGKVAAVCSAPASRRRRELIQAQARCHSPLDAGMRNRPPHLRHSNRRQETIIGATPLCRVILCTLYWALSITS